jgi:hypothetical protein
MLDDVNYPVKLNKPSEQRTFVIEPKYIVRPLFCFLSDIRVLQVEFKEILSPTLVEAGCLALLQSTFKQTAFLRCVPHLYMFVFVPWLGENGSAFFFYCIQTIG